MITIEAIGLDKANQQLAYVREAIAAYSGCYYRGSTRTDGHRNSEIMTFLKEGKARRDLKTLSNENAEVIATAWQHEVERRMNDFAESKFAGGPAATMPAMQMARAQSAAGFKAASKVILRLLAERIAQNLTADDNGNISPAPKVSESYAKSRETKYSVARDEVYKATGQLFADMDSSNVGQVVLVPGSGVK